MGEGQKASFSYFCSLQFSNCWQVGGWWLGAESLNKGGSNLIFCVPVSIQGWGTQGESKTSSFCF